MKKSIFTLFFVFVVFALCGCSQRDILPQKLYEKNSVRLIREIDKAGQIKMTYAFGTNSENFKNLGLSENDIKVYKFYLASYINALSKQYKDKAKEGVAVSPCIYYSDIDALGFCITFKNSNAQSEFYESTNQKRDGFKLQKRLFINRHILKIDFPIQTKESADSFLFPTKFALQQTAQENSISQTIIDDCLRLLNDTIFIYDFSNEEVSLKSQTTYFDGEKTHNFFATNIDEIETPIEFYYTSPNRAAWYFCALLVVLIGMIIAFSIQKRKNI